MAVGNDGILAGAPAHAVGSYGRSSVRGNIAATSDRSGNDVANVVCSHSREYRIHGHRHVRGAGAAVAVSTSYGVSSSSSG